MLTNEEFIIRQLYRHTRGKKVRWSFVFNGKRVVLTTSQLLSQRAFRREVFRVTSKFPPIKSRDDYDRGLDELTRNAIEQEENAVPG